MPIRLRIAAIFAGVMAAVLVATGLFLFLRLRADLRGAIDAALRARAGTILAAGGPIGGETLGGEDESPAQVLDREGRVLEPGAGERPLLRPEDLTGLDGPRFFDGAAPIDEEDELEPVRLLAVPSGDGILVVGASAEDAQETLGTLAALLAIGGPAALAASTAAVWLLIGAALRPVERMREEAEAVSTSEPGRRLPLPGTRDEVERLGASLNRMLERLQEALERERRFVDEASHELRTPVANLKAELELALSRARSPEELEGALRRGAADADALARLTEDLLVLARADRGRLPIRREDVDLAELVGQVLGGFEARAREAGVEVVSAAEGRAELDPLRLRQALSNLVDNALRHTPAGGRVSVRSSRSEDGHVLEVADTGPGFPPEVLAGAFEPFVRAAAERGAGDGGAGLGLAIVRAIMTAHGGTAEIENGPGARVRLRFPALRRDSPSSHLA